FFDAKAAAPLKSAWSARTTKNSACWPFAVCSMTQGAILLFIVGCSGGLPWLLAPEEPNAPTAAMAAATMNSEQRRRRKRDEVNARFDVIGLFFGKRASGVHRMPFWL